MKNNIISLIIFITLLLLIIIPTRYLNKVSHSLTDKTEDIELLITDEDWSKSYTNSVQLLESWQENKTIFSIFAPHNEIDDINKEIYKLSQYVKCSDKAESLASVHLIKFLINHVNELNKASIENIF